MHQKPILSYKDPFFARLWFTRDLQLHATLIHTFGIVSIDEETLSLSNNVENLWNILHGRLKYIHRWHSHNSDSAKKSLQKGNPIVAGVHRLVRKLTCKKWRFYVEKELVISI